MKVRKRTVAAVLAGAVTIVGVGVVASQNATAAQVRPGHSRLVPDAPRTDLPKINNGEITDIEVIGNRVFIAGSFTSIANVDRATRSHQRWLASYNIDTGRVDTDFRPTFDGARRGRRGLARRLGALRRRLVQHRRRRDQAEDRQAEPHHRRPDRRVHRERQRPRHRARRQQQRGLRGRPVHDRQRRRPQRPGGAQPDHRRGRHRLQQLQLSGGIGVGGLLTVQQLKLTHDDRKLLVVHTGRQIAGQDRYGVGLIDTATKALLPWRTRLWEDNLAFVGGIQRVFAGDIAPDDSYFVVTSGSGGDRPPINDTAMAVPDQRQRQRRSRSGSPGTSTASTRSPSPSGPSTSAGTSAGRSRRRRHCRGPAWTTSATAPARA